jgi:hypothetical protein
MLIRHSLILFVVFLVPHLSFAEWSLPSDRSVDWASVVWDIPDRNYDGGTNDIDITAAPYNADNTGVSNASSAIQSALDACGSDGNCDVVYLPAGTYLVNGTIRPPSNVTIRGAGKDSTNWQIGTSISTSIWVGDQYDDRVPDDSYFTTMNISSGYTKGSTSVVMSGDAESVFRVGDTAIISQLDETVADGRNPLISWNSSQWCGEYAFGSSYGTPPVSTGRRSIGQIVEITAINTGTETITFEPELAYTYESKWDPELTPAGYDRVSPSNWDVIKYVGIEDMRIYRTGAASNNVLGAHVLFRGAAYSWLKDCELELGDRRIINIWRSFRIVVKGSYWHHAVSYSSGGRGYLLDLTQYSSSNLIENNIGLYGNMVLNMSNPGHGNVIAYNYLDGSIQTEASQWQNVTAQPHCMHPMYTLFEGNDAGKLGADGYWGSSSHFVYLRNRIRSDDEYPENPLKSDDIQPLASLMHIHFPYATIVGNVLGLSSFPHGGGFDGYERQGGGWPPFNDRYVYLTTQTDDDLNGTNTWIRHGNYDYYNNDVIWCNETGGNCYGGSQDQDLPDSLYLTGKPSWWEDESDAGKCRPWPSIGPDVDGYATDIPAKDRYEDETYSGDLSCTGPITGVLVQ